MEEELRKKLLNSRKRKRVEGPFAKLIDELSECKEFSTVLELSQIPTQEQHTYLLQHPDFLVDFKAQVFILVQFGMPWEQFVMMGIHERIISAFKGELSSTANENTNGSTAIANDDSIGANDELDDATIQDQLNQKITLLQSLELEQNEIQKRKQVTENKIGKLRPMLKSVENDLQSVNQKLAELAEKKRLIIPHLEKIQKELNEDTRILAKVEQQLSTNQSLKELLIKEINDLKSRVILESTKTITETAKVKVQYFGTLEDGSLFVPLDIHIPHSDLPTVSRKNIAKPNYLYKPKDVLSIIPKVCNIAKSAQGNKDDTNNTFGQENHEILVSYRPEIVESWINYIAYFLNNKSLDPRQRAISTLEVVDRALKKNPDSVILWTIKLELAIKMHKTDPDSVRIVFTDALKHHPRHPHFYTTYMSWETDKVLRLDFLVQTIANFSASGGDDKSQCSLLLFNCIVQLLLHAPDRTLKLYHSFFTNEAFYFDEQQEHDFSNLLDQLEPIHRCVLDLILAFFKNTGTLPSYLFYDTPHHTLCIPKPFLILEFSRELNLEEWKESSKILGTEAEYFRARNEPRLYAAIQLNLYQINLQYGICTWKQVLESVDVLLDKVPDCTELLRLKSYAIAYCNGLDKALEFIRESGKGWELCISAIKLIYQMENNEAKVKDWILESDARLLFVSLDSLRNVNDLYEVLSQRTSSIKKQELFWIWYRICIVSIVEKNEGFLLDKPSLTALSEYPQVRLMNELLFRIRRVKGEDGTSCFSQLLQSVQNTEVHPFIPLFSYRSDMITTEISHCSYEQECIFEDLNPSEELVIHTFQHSRSEAKIFYTPLWLIQSFSDEAKSQLLQSSISFRARDALIWDALKTLYPHNQTIERDMHIYSMSIPKLA